MRNILILFVVMFGMATLTDVTTLAHDKAKGIVKQRMDAMKLMALEVKNLKKLMQKDRGLNASELKRAAGEIRKHAREIPSLFPEGSLDHPTEANKRIWEDFGDFQQEAERLSAKADDLIAYAAKERRADKGRPPPAAAFKALAQACQSCHKSYRTKR